MNLQELLHIKYPIIQGGMANIATGEFAAAVSNAGALGLIASGGMNHEQLKAEIDKCRTLTDKPFGVNLMLMNPDVDVIAELLRDEKIQVITTGAGNPGKYMAMWKENGSLVIPVAASVLLARKMVEAGADAIMIHSRKKDPAEIFEFVEKFRAKDQTTYLVVVPTSFNSVTEEEFKERGVNVVIYANQLMRATVPAIQNAANMILENHRAQECDSILMPFKEIIRMIPEEE